MSFLFKPEQVLNLKNSKSTCKIKEFLGGGGQGEVYRVIFDNQPFALKWYFPEQATPEQRESLKKICAINPPTKHFLWPTSLVECKKVSGFGYIMPLRPDKFVGLTDLMADRIDPSFGALAKAGYELANSFFQLHARGLCYRDISWGNVFFEPETGDILICDNDNVSIDDADQKAGVYGTPKFMAPEIVRGEARPSSRTDLYSLAVLLFYIFMVHHPLEGDKESNIRILDSAAMHLLYGKDPIFIFDPENKSNSPNPEHHNNALVYWPIYPNFFTGAIHPQLYRRLKRSR